MYVLTVCCGDMESKKKNGKRWPHDLGYGYRVVARDRQIVGSSRYNSSFT